MIKDDDGKKADSRAEIIFKIKIALRKQGDLLGRVHLGKCNRAVNLVLGFESPSVQSLEPVYSIPFLERF
jgi:hypothetical protein